MLTDIQKAREIMMAKRTPKGERLSGPVAMKTEKAVTEEGDVDGRHVAAEDLVSALSEKSPQRVNEALKNFMDLHASLSNRDA